MNKLTTRMLVLALLVVGIAGIYAMIYDVKNRSATPTPEYQISDSTMQLLNKMSNEEVIWVADYAGVNPLKLTGATLLLKDIKEDINPLLFDALLDRDKFVAAHVLLTFRTTGGFQGSLYEWNGLKIEYSGNDILFDGNNLHELQNFWQDKLQH